MKVFKTRNSSEWGIKIYGSSETEKMTTIAISGFGKVLIVNIKLALIKPVRYGQITEDGIVEGLAPRIYSVVVCPDVLENKEWVIKGCFGMKDHDTSPKYNEFTYTLPWTKWEHLNTSILNEKKEVVSDITGIEHKAKYSNENMHIFYVKDGENIVKVTGSLIRYVWNKGTGYFKFLQKIRKPFQKDILSFVFSQGVGPERDSWKGGTIAHAEKVSENETSEQAFTRYCKNQDLEYYHPTDIEIIRVEREIFNRDQRRRGNENKNIHETDVYIHSSNSLH